MKKFRKFLLGTFACASILSLAFAFGSCSCAKGGNSSSSTPTDSSTPSVSVDPDALTGFDVPETAFASYGFAVEIQAPIVIDGYGNVLGVSYTVKNSAGETVNDFNRGFFATDKNGYTVTYSVTVPSGETKTATTKYTVLNFAEDSEITLLDIKDGEVDFTELVADETTRTLLTTYATHAAWSLKPTYYNAANATYGFSGNAVDLSKVPHGVYTLSATVGGTEIYRTGLDVYDSTAPFEYTNVAAQNWTSTEKRTGNGLTSSTQWNETIYELASDEEKTAMNASGEFYKMTVEVNTNSYAWGQKMKLRPLTHTKAYYELYQDKALTFDWWFDIEDKTSYDFAVYGETSTSAYTTNYLRTVVIPMQDLVEDWDNFTEATANNKWNFKGAPWLMTGNDANVSKPLTLYMGNVSLVSMKQEPMKMLDVANGTMDMSELIADETLKASYKANAENTSWTFTPSFYTSVPSIVEFKGNTYDLTGVKGGIYLVTANDGTTTYKTSVDLYSSTGAFEYTDIAGQNWTSSDNRIGNGLISTTQWNQTTYFAATAEEKATVGATGDYYKLIVDGDFWKWSHSVKLLPQTHTKAYYEQFADKTIAFDWWFDMDGADSYEFTVYGASAATSYTKNTPRMVTIPMQDLLDDWDNFMDTTKNSKDKFKGEAWLETGGGSNGTNFKLYIGNVRVLNYEDKTTLLNVANGNVDLSELITDPALKQVFKANAETNVWKLTKNGVTTTFTGNTQSLTALSHGVYEITAETTGVAYGTKADLYDENIFELFDIASYSNGLTIDFTEKYTSYTTLNGVYVWTNGDNIRNSAASMTILTVTSVGGGETGITEKSGAFVKVDFTTKDGVTASPYRLGFALTHTKAYYELFAERSFSLEFVCDTAFNANDGKGVVVTQHYAAKTWKSGTATVQSILDDWDNASIGKFALIDTHWAGMPNATFYIGNVQLLEAE